MGKNLVILHGWGASAKSYDKLKPLLEQKGISVFVFDLPGFGNEAVPKEAWDVDDYAEWTRVKIERELDSRFYGNDNSERKIILFGHSFGGRIAIKLAARYSEKIEKLILCDAAGITPRPKVKINLFAQLSKVGKIIFSLPILNIIKPIAKKGIYFLVGARDYSRLENPVMKDIFRKVVDEDLTFCLANIKSKTLIIWGKDDKETLVLDAYAMNGKITGSKLEILENTGHSPHLECPEKLAEIIKGFIN
jgi:pimeloyl-ACP methyl ester carboxylesterase